MGVITRARLAQIIPGHLLELSIPDVFLTIRSIKEVNVKTLLTVSNKVRIPSLVYLSGGLVDDLLTYFFVKLWKVYMEANPIIMLYWMNMPFCVWLMRDLAGLLAALLTSVFSGGFPIILSQSLIQTGF